MLDIRKQVSLLLANGHQSAHLYPVAMIWDEAAIIAQRENTIQVTQAVLVQAAIGTVFGEEGGDYFTSVIKRLMNG